MQKTLAVPFAKQETKETFCSNALSNNVYLILMFQGLKSWFICRIVFLQPGNQKDKFKYNEKQQSLDWCKVYFSWLTDAEPSPPLLPVFSK